MERRKRKSPVEEYIESLMDSPEKLERCTQFYQNLRGFYRRKWNCPLKAPYIQGVEVNLFQLYEIVNSLGGWQKVSAGEKWGNVAQAVGIAEGVAVAEHAIKVLYMRYLSKYEQNETVGDVDDNEAELIGSRSRGKGFSSMANADCPISTTSRYTIDLYRGQTEKKSEPDYNRLVKSLYCGLPNEVDFAINVCTLLSHPGPRFLRLSSAPQILTLLVAHVGVFADEDDSMYDLYKSWEEASCHNFILFWEGAGIEDEEILALLPHVKPQKIPNVDLDLFGGLVHEFRLKDVVSWRVHQILSIVRNLSFEVINKPVMAASWPLMKFLFVCCGCKWSSLRTPALDALSNIASEIDLLCEESSATNHLLLKTVSRCLHSGDKLQIIRALEILAGLCNNERNESLLCEFLDSRVLNKIFEVLIVKDMMMCVYTLEALYQISELGALSCQNVSLLPHAIEILVNLATVEAVSFGPSGLSGIKVVEFHGPPQLAPPPPQNATPVHTRYVSRQATFATPAPPMTYHATARAAVAVHSPSVRVATIGSAATAVHASTAPTIGESKVEQLTARWLRLNCLCVTGNIIPRGELYATYVEDLRNHYNALSGSVQMFTNIIKALFPTVVVRVGTNTTSMVIENLKYAKGQGIATIENAKTISAANMQVTSVSSTPSTMAASHPVMQKILLGNTVSAAPLLNGHLAGPTLDSSTESVPSSALIANVVPLNNKVKLEVCRATVEAKDFVPDDGKREARIMRVENSSPNAQCPSEVIAQDSGPISGVTSASTVAPIMKEGSMAMNSTGKMSIDAAANSATADVKSVAIVSNTSTVPEFTRATTIGSTSTVINNLISNSAPVVSVTSASLSSVNICTGDSAGSASNSAVTNSSLVSAVTLPLVGNENQMPSVIASSKVPRIIDSPNLKSAVARRLNGLKDEKVESLVNGEAQRDSISNQVFVMPQKVLTNGVANVNSTEIKFEASAISNQVPTVIIKDGSNPSSSATIFCNHEGTSTTFHPVTPSSVPAKRRRTSRCNTPRVNDHACVERVVPSTSADGSGDYMCEWNGCGRTFPTASFVLYHCARDHVGDQATLQCHWPRCDSTVRTKLSMVTHLQDHHCSESLLLAAAKRRREGCGTVLGPVNPERPRDMHQHPGYAKNAAIEAIRRHAFNYLPRDITDDSEGPVTKSIRLTSSLILRNLARYSTDGRRLIRRHETLLSWLASSRLESSSALSQLLAELYNNQPSSS